MELWISATFSALLLMTFEPAQTSDEPNATLAFAVPNPVNTSTINGHICNQTPTPAPTPVPTPTLGFLTLKWALNCRADVIISEQSKSKPICNSSWTQVHNLLPHVCKDKKGCKGDPTAYGGEDVNGYNISERGVENATCKMLKVKCAEEHRPDLQAELRGYKVVTALFCCVLVALFVIRFARPMVKALKKRHKRQNRWIGPTQSHSVSYHRGQTTLQKNIDGEKRLSYPALERLAVSNSREPSSNRSSYNF